LRLEAAGSLEPEEFRPTPTYVELTCIRYVKHLDNPPYLWGPTATDDQRAQSEEGEVCDLPPQPPLHLHFPFSPPTGSCWADWPRAAGRVTQHGPSPDCIAIPQPAVGPGARWLCPPIRAGRRWADCAAARRWCRRGADRTGCPTPTRPQVSIHLWPGLACAALCPLPTVMLRAHYLCVTPGQIGGRLVLFDARTVPHEVHTRSPLPRLFNPRRSLPTHGGRLVDRITRCRPQRLGTQEDVSCSRISLFRARSSHT